MKYYQYMKQLRPAFATLYVDLPKLCISFTFCGLHILGNLLSNFRYLFWKCLYHFVLYYVKVSNDDVGV